jgi:hypothetical protein
VELSGFEDASKGQLERELTYVVIASGSSRLANYPKYFPPEASDVLVFSPCRHRLILDWAEYFWPSYTSFGPLEHGV